MKQDFERNCLKKPLKPLKSCIKLGENLDSGQNGDDFFDIAKFPGVNSSNADNILKLSRIYNMSKRKRFQTRKTDNEVIDMASEKLKESPLIILKGSIRFCQSNTLKKSPRSSNETHIFHGTLQQNSPAEKNKA